MHSLTWESWLLTLCNKEILWYRTNDLACVILSFLSFYPYCYFKIYLSWLIDKDKGWHRKHNIQQWTGILSILYSRIAQSVPRIKSRMKRLLEIDRTIGWQSPVYVSLLLHIMGRLLEQLEFNLAKCQCFYNGNASNILHLNTIWSPEQWQRDKWILTSHDSLTSHTCLQFCEE